MKKGGGGGEEKEEARKEGKGNVLFLRIAFSIFIFLSEDNGNKHK